MAPPLDKSVVLRRPKHLVSDSLIEVLTGVNLDALARARLRNSTSQKETEHMVSTHSAPVSQEVVVVPAPPTFSPTAIPPPAVVYRAIPPLPPPPPPPPPPPQPLLTSGVVVPVPFIYTGPPASTLTYYPACIQSQISPSPVLPHTLPSYSVGASTAQTSQYSKEGVTIQCHICRKCRNPRSRGYHRDHPLIPGEIAVSELCRRCEKEASEQKGARLRCSRTTEESEISVEIKTSQPKRQKARKVTVIFNRNSSPESSSHRGHGHRGRSHEKHEQSRPSREINPRKPSPTSPSRRHHGHNYEETDVVYDRSTRVLNGSPEKSYNGSIDEQFHYQGTHRDPRSPSEHRDPHHQFREIVIRRARSPHSSTSYRRSQDTRHERPVPSNRIRHVIAPRSEHFHRQHQSPIRNRHNLPRSGDTGLELDFDMSRLLCADEDDDTRSISTSYRISRAPNQRFGQSKPSEIGRDRSESRSHKTNHEEDARSQRSLSTTRLSRRSFDTAIPPSCTPPPPPPVPLPPARVFSYEEYVDHHMQPPSPPPQASRAPSPPYPTSPPPTVEVFGEEEFTTQERRVRWQDIESSSIPNESYSNNWDTRSNYNGSTYGRARREASPSRSHSRSHSQDRRTSRSRSQSQSRSSTIDV